MDLLAMLGCRRDSGCSVSAVQRVFLRLSWRLGVTPSELGELRLVDVLVRLRGCS